MARAALGLAIAVLILAVVGLAIGGWRMNSAINDLGETLAAINESQKALVNSQMQVNRPLVIRGRLYLGEKSKPADYAEVHLYRLPEAKLVERISADNEGRFITPPLEPGSYFLIAPLVGELNPSVYHAETIKDYAPLFVVQSAPISVFPWAKIREVELDLAMIDVGQISYELTKPLPGEIPLRIPAETQRKWLEARPLGPAEASKRFHDGMQLYATLVVVIPQNGPEHVPIRDVWKGKPEDWPKLGIYGHHMWDANIEFGSNRSFGTLLPGKAELFESIRGSSYSTALREGEYRVGAFVRLRTDQELGGPFAGNAQETFARLPETAVVTIEVKNGQRAHLKITPPEDLEELRAALDHASESEERLAEIVDKIRPAKVEIVGQMEMIKQ